MITHVLVARCIGVIVGLERFTMNGAGHVKVTCFARGQRRERHGIEAGFAKDGGTRKSGIFVDAIARAR